MKDPAREKANLVVEAVMERKAIDPVLLKVGHLTSIADYFFICSGRSSRQVQSIAENILDKVKKKGGYLPLGKEGVSGGQWILIDYGDVVVHIFYQPVREIYDLEGLWMEAESMALPENEAAVAAR